MQRRTRRPLARIGRSVQRSLRRAGRALARRKARRYQRKVDRVEEAERKAYMRNFDRLSFQDRILVMMSAAGESNRVLSDQDFARGMMRIKELNKPGVDARAVLKARIANARSHGVPRLLRQMGARRRRGRKP